jgi:hypothetical protein
MKKEAKEKNFAKQKSKQEAKHMEKIEEEKCAKGKTRRKTKQSANTKT